MMEKPVDIKDLKNNVLQFINKLVFKLLLPITHAEQQMICNRYKKYNFEKRVLENNRANYR